MKAGAKAGPTSTPGAKAFGALQEVWMVAHNQTPALSPSTITFLAEAFDVWLANDGERSFDEIFGFRVKRRGQAGKPYVERYRREIQRWFIGHLIGVLMGAGMNDREAARAVSAAINKSTDTRFRKQLRELGLTAPAKQRKRTVKIRSGGCEVQELEHLPPDSILEIFGAHGGEAWARLLGYFGDCEESRRFALLAPPADQETANFLFFAQGSRAFPFRDPGDLMAAIPQESLPSRFKGNSKG